MVAPCFGWLRSIYNCPHTAMPMRCRNGDANGAASLAETSTSSVTSNGRADVIAPSVPRADMDIQPPLTMRRCVCCAPAGYLTTNASSGGCSLCSFLFLAAHECLLLLHALAEGNDP